MLLDTVLTVHWFFVDLEVAGCIRYFIAANVSDVHGKY